MSHQDTPNPAPVPDEIYRAAAIAAMRSHVNDPARVDQLPTESLNWLVENVWLTDQVRAAAKVAYQAGAESNAELIAALAEERDIWRKRLTDPPNREWLAAIDNALRNGSYMTGANLAFEYLCDSLGVNREELTFDPNWPRPGSET